MSDVTVYKLDEEGREVWSYPATVLERGEQCLQVEAFFDRDWVDLGFVVFRRGDRFVETYYGDRWYNVFAVYGSRDGDGPGGEPWRFKGWYCNVCRPAEITSNAVRCEDLALDVWVTPQGETTVLDEDEFAELDLSQEERKRGRQALDRILELAQRQQLPG